jgi:D-lactate dehydrogenase (cytochrome)
MQPLRSRASQAVVLKSWTRRVSPQTAGRQLGFVAARRYLSQEKTPERPPSNEDKLGRTFYGEVSGSIQQRLAREKADRARFAMEREKISNARNWALTIGMHRTNFAPTTSRGKEERDRTYWT